MYRPVVSVVANAVGHLDLVTLGVGFSRSGPTWFGRRHRGRGAQRAPGELVWRVCRMPTP